ncbi:MAG: endonuclease III domain-containing protein [Paracoccaceae bacterium]
MKKIDRATYVVTRLNEIYPETPVPLNHRNYFELLIAVLLSAQCTDERVNQVTPRLFALADNPLGMSKLETEKIYEIIRPCGLAPQKSSNISKLSIILCEQHQGVVPSNFEDLERLPGVGHKTASVVMSQGFGYPAFPVDTHIHRLAQRWGLTSGKKCNSN